MSKRFVSEAEHDCMSRIAHHAGEASSSMVKMAELRPDQSDQWMKAAAMLKALQGQVFDLASQGLLTREAGVFGGGKLS